VPSTNILTVESFSSGEHSKLSKFSNKKKFYLEGKLEKKYWKIPFIQIDYFK
jgi:hypothetical protein